METTRTALKTFAGCIFPTDQRCNLRYRADLCVECESHLTARRQRRAKEAAVQAPITVGNYTAVPCVSTFGFAAVYIVKASGGAIVGTLTVNAPGTDGFNTFPVTAIREGRSPLGGSWRKMARFWTIEEALAAFIPAA